MEDDGQVAYADDLEHPSLFAYSPLGPKTPVAMLRRLDRFESVGDIVRKAPLRFWVMRVLGLPLSAIIFGGSWALYGSFESPHSNNNNLLLHSVLSMSFVLPLGATLSYPLAVFRLKSAVSWMKPLSRSALQCMPWRYVCAMRVHNVLWRATLLSLTCAPLAFAIATLLMLAFSATAKSMDAK